MLCFRRPGYGYGYTGEGFLLRQLCLFRRSLEKFIK